MKKLLISIASFLASCSISFAAAVTKTVELCYRQSEFSFSHDVAGFLQIIPQGGIYSYDENIENPGLPYFSVAFYVPGDQLYQDCSPTFSKSLLYDNCILAPAPIPQPTSCVQADNAPRKASYSKAIYPQDNVRFTGETSIGNSKILYFTVCPFIYDNSDKRLYFTESIKLDITLQESANVKTPSTGLPTGPGIASQLTHLVINPEDYMSVADSVMPAGNFPNKLDYVIVTDNDLADSFLPLRNWKRQKGVWTEIMTVEDIAQKYEGASLQEKIKRCLYDLYTKRHLEYVLLGGDDTVVPVRYCRSKVYETVEEQMPTDMYYSCFDGTFNWDDNGNGVYGEPKDNVGLLQNIYLSRLPIRTSSEVNTYTNRLISYEKMNNQYSWNKNMLYCGCLLADSLKGNRSDGEKIEDKLYDEVINVFWNGERKKLCDTYNDFGYDRISYKAIQEQLSTGYAFASFTTHGAPWCFNLRSNGYFTNTDASEIVNTGYTIITTTACSTNAFDYCDKEGGYEVPCLSESFIRNENSGIISYLGCSREGWYFYDYSDGPTLSFEMGFYRNLLSNRFVDKNYAKIVAYSKSELICYSKNDGAYRWTQFALNPIGDAEMPVFTNTPQKLPNTKIEIDNGTLSVKAGIDSCTICVMSRLDNGHSYYKVFHNAKDVCFTNIVDSMSLCITKQNYIPQVINDVQTYNMLTHPVGGTIIGVGKVGSGDDFVIKYHVAKPDSEAKIVVSPYDGSPSKSIPVSADSEMLKLSSQQFRKGVLGISLFVNSKLASSVNYNNE